jgi:hypothetical protein
MEIIEPRAQLCMKSALEKNPNDWFVMPKLQFHAQ